MRIDTALGATLEPVDAATARALGDDSGARGMVVTSIARGGPADSAGLRVVDLIERIQGRPARCSAAVADSLKRTPATVIINRHGNRARVEIAVRSRGLPGA
jgi:S1-C subfamily serine protease